jgi:D-alanyl-D-alanine carboxypeptidase/D-alanyl-D-alanine-endopeptidase (penicillin-binding protein 4)
VVRAKTGTLTGVDTEAGIVVDGSGALRLFAFLADATTGDVEASRDALDAAASRLVP